MGLDFNIDSQIVVQTAVQWAADTDVYSAKRILVTSDALYTGTDQRKWKLANGTDTWANLDYMPIFRNTGTANKVVKSNGTDLVDSSISDDGTDVEIDADTFYFFASGGEEILAGGGEAYISTDGLGTRFFLIESTGATVRHDVKAVLNAPVVNLPQETASRIMATDSSKNIDTPYTLTTSTSLAGNSDTNIPSEKAVKAYVDSSVVGLMDYRGTFDASVNAYPSSGGSGTAGAILKSDFWIVSVAGTLPTGLVVEPGDLVIAKQDTPGNTEANWNIVQYNIGFTPENSANKTDTMAGNTASSIKYLSAKGVYDWGIATFQQINAVLTGLISLGATAFGTTAGTFAQGNDSRFNRVFSPIHTVTSNSHTGDTNETILFASSLIPANTFLSGDNMMIKQKVSATSNGNGKVFRAYLNTTNDLTGSPVQIAQAQLSSGAGGSTMFVRNYKITASNNLVGSTPSTNLLTDEGNTAVTQDNITVDFTQGLYFILSVQLAVNTDTAFVRDIRSTIHRP